MPKVTVSQLNFHKKQEIKEILGKISHKRYKNSKNTLKVDNITHILGFSKTIYHARRLLNTKKLKIDNKKAQNESHSIKAGSVIKIT